MYEGCCTIKSLVPERGAAWNGTHECRVVRAELVPLDSLRAVTYSAAVVSAKQSLSFLEMLFLEVTLNHANVYTFDRAMIVPLRPGAQVFALCILLEAVEKSVDMDAKCAAWLASVAAFEQLVVSEKVSVPRPRE